MTFVIGASTAETPE